MPELSATLARSLPGALCCCLVLAPLAASTQPVSSQRTGSVEGKVVRADTGAPLENAKVTIGYWRGRGPETNTDPQGRFSFQGVEAGRCVLRVEHEGFLTHNPPPSRPFELGPGQKLSDWLIRLAPAAAIAGRVLGDDGQPLRRMQVAVLRAAYSREGPDLEEVAQTLTDADGRYRFGSLAAGRYFVAAAAHASEPNRARTPTYHPGALDWTRATPLELASGGERGDVDVRAVQRGVLLRGRVELPVTPGRVATGEIFLERPRPASFCCGWAVLRSDASFEIRDVPPGSYLVHANAALSPAPAHSGSVRVDVADSDVAGIAIPTAQPFKLSGRVRIEGSPVPLTGLKVFLEVARPMLVRISDVAADGSFELMDVPPGTHRFLLAEGRAVYVKAARVAGRELPDSRIDVAYTPPAPLELILGSDAGRVEGSVLDAQKKPAPDCFVVLVPDASRHARDWLFRTGRSDGGGRFVLYGVAPGDYTAYAWTDVRDHAYENQQFLEAYPGFGKRLTVSPTGAANVELQLIER